MAHLLDLPHEILIVILQKYFVGTFVKVAHKADFPHPRSNISSSSMRRTPDLIKRTTPIWPKKHGLNIFLVNKLFHDLAQDIFLQTAIFYYDRGYGSKPWQVYFEKPRFCLEETLDVRHISGDSGLAAALSSAQIGRAHV